MEESDVFLSCSVKIEFSCLLQDIRWDFFLTLLMLNCSLFTMESSSSTTCFYFKRRWGVTLCNWRGRFDVSWHQYNFRGSPWVFSWGNMGCYSSGESSSYCCELLKFIFFLKIYGNFSVNDQFFFFLKIYEKL